MSSILLGVASTESLAADEVSGRFKCSRGVCAILWAPSPSSSARTTASGSWSMTVSSTRAARSGTRRPCSQSCRARTSRPKRSANFCRLSRNRLRRATIRGAEGSSIKIDRANPTSLTPAGTCPAQLAQSSRSPYDRCGVGRRHDCCFHFHAQIFWEQLPDGTLICTSVEDLHRWSFMRILCGTAAVWSSLPHNSGGAIESLVTGFER